MKYLIKLFSLIYLVIIISACKKEQEKAGINKDQKSNYFFEQAFPGQHGEFLTYIIGEDTIVVEKINGKYVYQGDIILTNEQLKISSTKGAGLGLWNYRWINNTVYYSIGPSFPNPERVTDAMYASGVAHVF